MKRLLLVLLVLPLLATPSAEAKGIKWVKVCGPSDCTKTPERELEFEESPLIFPPWVMSGRPDPPPKQAAPWLRVRVAYARSDRQVRSVAAPRLGYAGGDQDGPYGFVWQRLDGDEQRTYKVLGRGLERFPAATLPGLDRQMEEDPMEFGQLLQQFASDDKVTAAVVLIAADVVLGVLAALKLGTFKLSYLADFAKNDILFKLVPWFVLYSAGKVAADQSIVISGLDFGTVADGAYVIIVGAWVGSILSSVRQLGLSSDNEKAAEVSGQPQGKFATLLGPEQS